MDFFGAKYPIGCHQLNAPNHQLQNTSSLWLYWPQYGFPLFLLPLIYTATFRWLPQILETKQLIELVSETQCQYLQNGGRNEATSCEHWSTPKTIQNVSNHTSTLEQVRSNVKEENWLMICSIIGNAVELSNLKVFCPFSVSFRGTKPFKPCQQ